LSKPAVGGVLKALRNDFMRKEDEALLLSMTPKEKKIQSNLPP
jgi:hypothetical protein